MINSIRLQNFRSYTDDSFEFEAGVNIIVGPNASGKTNLLQAVAVILNGNSFKPRDNELVRFGKNWSRLDCVADGQQRILKISNEDDRLQKIYEINNQLIRRLTLDKTLPVVLFEPNHLQLMIRGPEQRRDYFDDLLERTLPGFKTTAAKYRRAVAQRNALLKRGPAKAQQQLFVWNIRLSELGAEIVQARYALLETFNKKISRVYSQIAGKRTSIKLDYVTPLRIDNYSSSLLSHLEKNTNRDFNLGFTSYGPHREDIGITINKKPAATHASRGEMRSIVLALKIAELDLLESARDTKPLLLLDDVFSELDGARRRHLVEHLKNHQTLITTTDADSVIAHFDSHHLISLQK
ncbi:hypothetical protein A3F65_02605 [Candidatus Saccharibacteria bacterium RIFCSPHIGHO2_12_FULL_47_16b]|nr:MAG: hypothetical protein A3F65_02605 [Candidatus Saccharibacteria bacterium RIFCSPHIGHO2_12_FULL_47_16b]